MSSRCASSPTRGRPLPRLAVAVALALASATLVGAQTSGPTNTGPTPVPFPGGSAPFIRGDANADAMVDIGDGVRVLEHLFESNALGCLDAGDANDDEQVNIADAITIFAFLFTSGPAPAAPFPDCGADPTSPLALGCGTHDVCAPTTDRATSTHILRRIAYGGTPAEIEDLETIGAEAYILEQLDPFLIPENPAVDAAIASFPIDNNYAFYYRHVLFRGLYSNRQLLEQMTDFWSNHFNTYFWTVRNHFRNLDGGTVYDNVTSRVVAMHLEAREDDAFRQDGLGYFEDLVLASATSPTMLIYLDNISNLASAPNENYAREILELSTVGVNGGYTQNDVEELARCFTGWTIRKKLPMDVGDPLAPPLANNDPAGEWSFHFDPPTHDYGAKQLFTTTSYPLSIPARAADSVDGVLDGYEVIAHLAVTSQTAQYVSSKLIQKFVSDNVPPALLAQCIGTWLSTQGDLAAVMETILLSNEFLGTANRWNKVKTPMETLLSTLRTLEGDMANAGQVVGTLANLVHVPLNFNTPDGYPELGDDWIGTSKLVDIIQFNQRIHNGASDTSFDPGAVQIAAGIDGADPVAVVDFWLEFMFAGATTPVDEALALQFFTTDDNGLPASYSPGTVLYDTQLRKFLAFLRSWPQAVKQ